MLQHIIRLTPEVSEVVDTIRKNTTRPEFQQLPTNEQNNYIVNQILENTFEGMDNIDNIMSSLELI